MKKLSVYFKSVFVGVIGVVLALGAREYLDTQGHIDDLGGINNFIALFGTLFGLLLAFVVFEAWKQYTDLSNHISLEATGCERLFRTSRYFRNKELDSSLKKLLTTYLSTVVDDNFESNASGVRNPKSASAFRAISTEIRDVKFDDDHDAVVFAQLLEEYTHLSEVRNNRINLGTTRLPSMLKTSVALFKLVALSVVVIMPFNSSTYHAYLAFAMFFFLSLLHFLIRDLDNPFRGYWNIGTEEYERVVSNLENNYNDQ